MKRLTHETREGVAASNAFFASAGTMGHIGAALSAGND
jgi:hypothetical protein